MVSHEVGLDTNADVLDYARRVDQYIRALHAIVVEARRILSGVDAFPWAEWAAFRVNWDTYYFEDIEHGFVLWFARDTVAAYEKQAHAWEGVIAQHYGKRPEGPSPVTIRTGNGGFGLLIVAGVVGLSVWALRK